MTPVLFFTKIFNNNNKGSSSAATINSYNHEYLVQQRNNEPAHSAIFIYKKGICKRSDDEKIIHFIRMWKRKTLS
jgi:hypothetical protein